MTLDRPPVDALTAAERRDVERIRRYWTNGPGDHKGGMPRLLAILDRVAPPPRPTARERD